MNEGISHNEPKPIMQVRVDLEWEGEAVLRASAALDLEAKIRLEMDLPEDRRTDLPESFWMPVSSDDSDRQQLMSLKLMLEMMLRSCLENGLTEILGVNISLDQGAPRPNRADA